MEFGVWSVECGVWSVEFANRTFAICKTSVPANYDAPLQNGIYYCTFSKDAPDGTSRSRASCRVAAVTFHHSISEMDFGEGLYSSRIILPLFISMIWSAMGVMALLWVMSTTVIFSRRQVS